MTAYSNTRIANSVDFAYSFLPNASYLLLTLSRLSLRLTITDARHENAAEYKCTVSFTESGNTFTSHSLYYLVINDDVVLEVLTPFVLADVTNAQATLSFSSKCYTQATLSFSSKCYAHFQVMDF